MKNILIPIGSSRNILSHLQYAVDFAEAFEARLFVVQVFEGSTITGTAEHVPSMQNQIFLNSLLSKVNVKNVEVLIKTVKGNLIDVLEEVCKTEAIDLI